MCPPVPQTARHPHPPAANDMEAPALGRSGASGDSDSIGKPGYPGIHRRLCRPRGFRRRVCQRVFLFGHWGGACFGLFTLAAVGQAAGSEKKTNNEPIKAIDAALNSRAGLEFLIERVKATVEIKEEYALPFKKALAHKVLPLDCEKCARMYQDSIVPFLEDCRKELANN